MIHELKCAPTYFRDVCLGLKTAEYRVDDRTPLFRARDLLWLREYTRGRGEYLGGEALVEVTHVLRRSDDRTVVEIPEGYAMLSIALVGYRASTPPGIARSVPWDWVKP